MKTKDLVELIREGVTPIVRFRDPHNLAEVEPDPGMIGRIKSVKIDELGPGNTIACFFVDFFEFTEKNIPFAQKNFYDAEGNPVLTWMEMDYYEEESKMCDIHEMYLEDGEHCDLTHFEIVPENTLLFEYTNSGSSLSYTNWLEEKLLSKKEL